MVHTVQQLVTFCKNDMPTRKDLTGGYYDAGDNIKLGFPLAFSLTSLAWGLLHYWEAYIGQCSFYKLSSQWLIMKYFF